MKLWLFSLHWLLNCVVISALSNHGRTFYLAFPENRLLAEYPRVRLYITSLLTIPVSVNIQMPFMMGYHIDYIVNGLALTIPPGEVVMQEFPYTVQVEGTGFSDKGMVVEADGDISIHVGQINDLSSDVYLALPVDSLYTDYYAMTYVYTEDSVYPQGPTEIVIVGIVEPTTVELRFPGDMEGTLNRLIDAGLNCNIFNNTCFAELFWCQTLQIQSMSDLTGTHIISSAPVAVFAGTTWTSVGHVIMGDHMIEQVPPTSTWGGEFVVIPVANRTSGDVVRVLAKENGTTVLYKLYPSNEKIPANLENGAYHDFELPAYQFAHILSNKAILVAQFTKSNGADKFKLSDPFMTYITPTAQYSTSLSFSEIMSLHQTFYNSLALVTDVGNPSENLFLNDRPASVFTAQDWINVPNTNYKLNTLYLPVPVEIEHPRYYKIHTTEAGSIIGGILYGLKFQEAFGAIIGQQLDFIALEYSCLTFKMQWEDSFDNDCDGISDEEIANGIDDDNDGVIDEDIFNEKQTRQQYELEQQLNALNGNDKQNIGTTDSSNTDNSGDNAVNDGSDNNGDDGNVNNDMSNQMTTIDTNANYLLTSLLPNGPNDGKGEGYTSADPLYNSRDGGQSEMNTADYLHHTDDSANDADGDNTGNELSGLLTTESHFGINGEGGNGDVTTSDNLSNNIKDVSTRNFLSDFTGGDNENDSDDLVDDNDNSGDNAGENGNKDSDSQHQTSNSWFTFASNTITTDSLLGNNNSNNSDGENDNRTSVFTATQYHTSSISNENTSVNHLMTTQTPGFNSDQTKESFLEHNKMMIIIPLCVLFGLPLLCCVFIFTKPFILVIVCDKKENDTNKVTPEQINDDRNRQKRMSVYQSSKPDRIDCRRESSKPCDYIIGEKEYSKQRQFTSKECRKVFKSENEVTNKRSLARSKRS